ncbi:hypothetical protein A9CBEGH2_07710 [Amedibacterium intestinale]|uniref:ribbon-helix-helix protein, CopG family n=1 Tax=Amedibacterium intestinale TaxID=2583452 RepID=UPI0013744CFF|nr:ribbon-helix-helix protein, CopG family [Amedibacterium intestinale]BBK61831.1 hypothetical protein A9CBEGH2_07710 [Amedibacterium intestinale]
MAKMGRPKSENPKGQQITLRLENDLYDEFTKKCKKLNLNKSTLIREWIVEFLENKKEVD